MTTTFIKYLTIATLLFSSVLFSIQPTAAKELRDVVGFSPGDLDQTGQLSDIDITDEVALGTNNPTIVVLRLINTALTLLGTLCVILLIYGGFLWVWARGDSEQIQKSKDILQGTIIGLVIVLASLGITQYVFTRVADITGATYSGVQNPE